MNKWKVKRVFSRGCVYVCALIVLLWTMLPLLWMFISSITPTVDLLVTEGNWISGNVNFNRYRAIFYVREHGGGSLTSAGAVFVNSLQLSIFVSVITVTCAIIMGGLAAYAFARFDMRFRNLLLMGTMFFQLVPAITLVIPLYIIAAIIGAIDRPAFLIVLYLSFVLPYVIWVMNGYYRTLPRELEAAARIDGCTWFQAYRLIVLPLAKPGLVAVGALSFLMCWDEFIYALIFMTSLGNKTMPVAIAEFGTRFGIDYGMVMTAGVIATIFPMLLTLIFQRHIVSGLTSGGVKG